MGSQLGIAPSLRMLHKNADDLIQHRDSAQFAFEVSNHQHSINHQH
jgi:hypothetical protein